MAEEAIKDKYKGPKTIAFFAAVLLASIWYPRAMEGIALLCAVVMTHELGHFFVAKAAGIRIETFSIGFGEPLVSLERGGTRYQIAPIPLGGFVKFKGEIEDKQEQQGLHPPDEFLGKPWYVRAMVALAGPVTNILAPVFILTLIYATVGRPFFIAPPLVTDVAANSAAQEAGIKNGDQIIKIDGQWATDVNILISMVDSAARAHPGKKTELVVLRDGKQLQISALSRLNSDSGRYRLGVGIRPGPAPLRRIVKNVIPSTPAEKAGFKLGDTVLSVGGVLLKQGADFPKLFYDAKADKDGKIPVELARAGSTLTLLVLKAQPLPDSIDKKIVGVLGLEFEFNSDVINKDEKQYEKLKPLEAGKIASLEVAFRVSMMVRGLGDLFSGHVKVKESVAGPVAIARMASAEAKTGFMDLLFFMITISLVLGVMNLLPLPVIDGGVFLLCVIEAIRGKAFSVKTQTVMQYASVALIVAVMLFATYNDLGNLFHSILNK